MQARRPQLAELGVFLLVVALPLVFTPFSASPFGDPKLVVLSAACLCLVASGLPADRRTTMAGAALVIVAALAAAFGVDPAEALTAQTNSDGSGLITVVCIAVVASIGGALPADLRARALRWVVGAAVTVAGLGIAFRLVPGPLEDLFPGQGLAGSTMGNQVFAIALVAAALGVLLTSESLSSSRMWWSQLVVLSVGIASFGERSSLAFVVVTGVVGLWRRTDRRRRIGKALVVVALLVLAWQVVAPQLPIPSTLGSQLTSLTSDRARFVSWRVGLESVADRPLLGWGPGSTKSAYLANASPTDIEITTRGVGDAHNLFVGTLVEMGVLGLVAMVVFVVAALTDLLDG
ncbi:MAG: O-antigen ligase family protein, partial [Actinomycetota bacterium]